MQEIIKELQRKLEALAAEFYQESGARMLNVEIRVTPFETTHKIGLEFLDGHSNTAQEKPVPGCGPACKGD